MSDLRLFLVSIIATLLAWLFLFDAQKLAAG